MKKQKSRPTYCLVLTLNGNFVVQLEYSFQTDHHGQFVNIGASFVALSYRNTRTNFDQLFDLCQVNGQRMTEICVAVFCKLAHQ